MSTDLAQKCINTIRFLSADAVEKADSGHPGLPMGMADVAYVLWTEFMKYNPKHPEWVDRDRFVLSAGHGSMLLYSMLYLTGYPMTMDEIKRFRQWGSKTPGHPEYELETGVETTTGPLGQGFATGVGMALAARMLAARYNVPGRKIVDHNIYAIVSDGDMMEGISHEAASLAGHLGLSEIIYLYDDNKISLVGPTDWAFTEDVGARFRAYNWFVQEVDAHDREAVAAALQAAQQETGRPSLILTRSHIGYSAPTKQDTADAHGSPLGQAEVTGAKQALGWPLEPDFLVPDDVLAHMRLAVEKGQAAEGEWAARFEAYRAEYPELAAEFEGRMRGELPEGWDADLPTYAGVTKAIATRNASGEVINAIAPHLPALVGGAADLASSTKTLIGDEKHVSKDDFDAPNIRFGVREHAMGGMLNGMALHGGFIPFGGTFLTFSDYMRPSVRLAALMKAHVIYVWTHDSVWLGEDGPTHKPVEHAAALRAIPNLIVLRPSDATETAEAWRFAVAHDGPVGMLFTRQGVPVIDREKYAPASNLAQGAYVLADAGGRPDIILIATGSEVSLALEAREILGKEGVDARVVSMPSWELFEAQSQEYQDGVLPPEITHRVAIEAGVSMGWDRYLGPKGLMYGIDHFGASAPYKVLMEQWGFTGPAIAKRALELLAE